MKLSFLVINLVIKLTFVKCTIMKMRIIKFIVIKNEYSNQKRFYIKNKFRAKAKTKNRNIKTVTVLFNNK